MPLLQQISTDQIIIIIIVIIIFIIMSQQHQLPDDSAVKMAKQTSRHKIEEDVKEKVRSVYERAPNNVKRVLDLSSEKGSSIKGSFVMPSN